MSSVGLVLVSHDCVLDRGYSCLVVNDLMQPLSCEDLILEYLKLSSKYLPLTQLVPSYVAHMKVDEPRDDTDTDEVSMRSFSTYSWY